MKNITIENFNHSNIIEWVSDYSHTDKVRFAIYCAELTLDLYTGPSDEPKKAIHAAKNWLLDQSEENERKCMDAAYSAYAAVATGTATVTAAVGAVYSAYVASAYSSYAASVYAAYAASAAVATVTAASCESETKSKIIAWLVNFNSAKPC